MKLETAVVIFKGLAFVAVGIFTPWTAALSQWINSGEWPSKIIWVGVIAPASFIGGGSALLAFLSGSFPEYQQQKKADDTGEVQTIETKPTVKTGNTDFLAKEKMKLP